MFFYQARDVTGDSLISSYSITAPGSWLVISAKDNATLAQGMTGLIGRGLWTNLGGEYAAYDPNLGTLLSRPAAEIQMVSTTDYGPNNLRYIAASFFSIRIMSMVMFVVAAALLLGMTTYVRVRAAGVKNHD